MPRECRRLGLLHTGGIHSGSLRKFRGLGLLRVSDVVLLPRGAQSQWLEWSKDSDNLLLPRAAS